MKYKASVIIPVWNTIEYTLRTIATMRDYTKLPFEFVIIDNASTDIGTKAFKYLKDTIYIRNETNEGFVKAVNKGISLANGEHIIIGNNDILVTHNWLEKMVDSIKNDIGIVSLLVNDGGKAQSIIAQEIDGLLKVTPENTDKINELLEKKYKGQINIAEHSIIFCLALITREVFKKIGYLGEEFGVGFGDDGDFCIRASDAGFKMVVRKDGFFFHHRRTTFKQLYQVEEINKMQNFNIKLLTKKHPSHYESILRNIKTKNPINILLTNNHLKVPGGSETFTYSMAKALYELGHNVDVLTFSEGDVSDRIKEFTNVIGSCEKNYDLYLINHTTCLEHLKPRQGFKIFTSHGIYPTLEQAERGANIYVSISEEVKQHLSNKLFDSEIIRNGIDCHRFHGKRTINKELKSVLSMCQGVEARNMIRQACEEMGLEFDYVGIEKRIWNVEDYINKADLVVGLGRSAYEAMAMGREVLVFDMRGYSPLKTADGIVTKENIDELIKNNLSGRRFCLEMNVEQIKHEFMQYNSERGTFNSNYVYENLNIERQVNKYLKLYNDRPNRTNES